VKSLDFCPRIYFHSLRRKSLPGTGFTRRPAKAGWLPARRAAPTFARQSSGVRVGGLAGEWRVGTLEPAEKNGETHA
jgi:hypothetical protein